MYLLTGEDMAALRDPAVPLTLEALQARLKPIVGGLCWTRSDLEEAVLNALDDIQDYAGSEGYEEELGEAAEAAVENRAWIDERVVVLDEMDWDHAVEATNEILFQRAAELVLVALRNEPEGESNV